MVTTRCFGCIAGLLLMMCLTRPVALGQNATLVASPVPGKLGFQPAANFAEAIIVPAQATAYLSGRGGGNSTVFATQVNMALSGLNQTITALGSSMDAGVSCTVYLEDIDNFDAMNAIYETYFTKILPSRTTIQVAALAGGSAIEVSMIAVDPKFAAMTASS